MRTRTEEGDGGVHASPTIHTFTQTWGSGRTFKRRETAIEQQLEIAELALAEEESREGLSFGRKLSVTRQIPRDQVLEDAAVGSVGHLGDL
jgi:hypothetical protein